MNRAVIAVADQVILQELRSRLDQSEMQVEVAFIAESTTELPSAVLTHKPSVVFVHDQLGPGLVSQVVRDLTLRNPALAVIVITASPSVASYGAALEAGARGILSYPFGLEDLDQRMAAVLEWGQTVRRVITDQQSAALAENRGGRVLTVTGAKGGVGATVVASHLAWDVATQQRDLRVCLVDLDIEKGDVPSFLDVSHRVSVAELAKISDDLSPRAVADTVVVHTSGLHLLLAPVEIRDTEAVTPEAIRRIVAQLRGSYHVVIIDAGAAVTTTQAAAVETADITLQLVTADVPALRAARRQVTFWESLAVTNPDGVHVVVNRFDRSSEIQQDTIDQLVLGRRSEILIPDLGRGLERAGNSRTPAEVRNQAWWKSLRAIAQEVGLVRPTTKPGKPARTDDSPPGPAKSGGSQKKSLTGAGRRAKAESGQVALETVALVPAALGVLVLCLQLVLLGLAFVWSGVAGDDAARAASLGQDPAAAVRKAVPAGFDGRVVSSTGQRVVVRVSSPLLIGHGVAREVNVDVEHTTVREPR
ncbi:MinD/ParA family protein [Microlunatus elymi]|uniref:MinD/ParA family protein n=1 Tax=Microlunatus elymi TaxID=2596828 RepID=A0A516PZK8_9ACTN|nr:cellulose synthase operon protein YhjQ/BcsQ [Microlunatus elymi]QDP96616.1 MinD/ParA family protein [Microlunatus elymi]